MKRTLFIAATVLLATAAHADVIATLENKGGGRIELSSTRVPGEVETLPGCKGAYIAKTWGNNGANDMYGCWRAVGAFTLLKGL